MDCGEGCVGSFCRAEEEPRTHPRDSPKGEVVFFHDDVFNTMYSLAFGNERVTKQKPSKKQNQNKRKRKTERDTNRDRDGKKKKEKQASL